MSRSPAAALRLLQFSDLHLGTPGYAPSLGLPEEGRAGLREDLLAVLDRLVDLAREREVDGVLVPGDLFDDEAVDAEMVRRAAGAFAALAPRPVFVAPGNHDPFRAGGYYGAAVLSARGGAWPGNVQVFRTETWATLPWPGRDDVQVTGSAYLRPVTTAERRLAPRIARPEASLSLLLVHGSRDGFAPAGKRVTLPFSEDELLAQGFTYAALGHYHDHSTVIDGDGAVRAAYAGCPQGRGLDETGPKGALVVTLRAGVEPELELVALAERPIHRLSLELGRVDTADSVVAAVDRAVRRAGVGPRDLVVAELTGRLAAGVEPHLPDATLDGAAGNVALRLEGLRPDHDLDAYRGGDAAPTTETRFARRLIELLEREEDPEERALLRDALDIGLDALHGGRIAPR